MKSYKERLTSRLRYKEGARDQRYRQSRVKNENTTPRTKEPNEYGLTKDKERSRKRERERKREKDLRGLLLWSKCPLKIRAEKKYFQKSIKSFHAV